MSAQIKVTPTIEVRHNGVAWLQGNWRDAPTDHGGMFEGVNLLTGKPESTGLALVVPGRTFHTLAVSA